jgi:hypothetical protein
VLRFTVDRERTLLGQGWRAGESFFLFVQDAEGNKLPNRGFSPQSIVNYFRFVLPKAEGTRIVDRLNPGKMYEARIAWPRSAWSSCGRLVAESPIPSPPRGVRRTPAAVFFVRCGPAFRCAW